MFYFTVSNVASNGQSKVSKNFKSDKITLPSHLIPVILRNIHDPNKGPSTALNQPSSSNIILNPPCLDKETVTENESLKLAPWQSKVLNDFFDN